MNQKHVGTYVFAMFLLVSWSSAATVDWQGGSTNLNDASKWYVLSTNEPTSTTGATQLPTTIDGAFVRNATTVTVDSTINAGQFRIGGAAYTGGTVGLTTVLVNTGGSLNIAPPLGNFGNVADLYVGNAYPGRVVQTGGTVKAFGVANAFVYVGYGANGSYSISDGVLTIGATMMAPRLNIGYATVTSGYGNGTFTQSGGLVELRAPGDEAYLDVGRASNSGTNPVGVYNMSGGTMDVLGTSTTGSLRYFAIGRDGGRGWFTQSDGLVKTGWVRLGYNGTAGGPWSDGYYTMTGGTLQAAYKFFVGRTDDITGAPISYGEFTVNQDAVLDCTSSFNATASGKIKLMVDSADNFNWVFGSWATIGSAVEVQLNGGYSPAHDQEWKLLTATPDTGGIYHVAATPSSITTDWTLVARDNQVFLQYAGGAALPHPGDANNDGAVNVGDLGILAANWNGTGKDWGTGDFTGEGSVNVGDLGVLAANWGWTGAPADQAPEPASLVLMGLGGLAMLRRRK